MDNQYEPPHSDVENASVANAAGISNAMIEAMRGTKPWVLLIGIVLIISSVFMVIATVGMIIATTIGMGVNGPETAPFIGVAIMYGVFSIIYIMMGVYLFKYSSAIGRLLYSGSIANMEDALHSQRKFWKMAGIITAIMLILMVLGFVAAMAIPFLSMGS